MFTKAQKFNLLVGTYTAGKSTGIYVYTFNAATGEASFTDSIKSSNPSYLTPTANAKYVYAVNENKPGDVSAYSFNKRKGKLKYLNTVPSGGKDPCYISTTSNGKFVFVANYSSGTVSVYRTTKGGKLLPAHQNIQHEGIGPNLQRQEAPHVHSVVLSSNEKYVYAADLGTDGVYVYSFNKKTGMLAPVNKTSTTAGGGPRHLVFSADAKFLYSIQELSGLLVVYAVDEANGRLSFVQEISSLPKEFNGAIGSADIHIASSGNFLYATNRGDANTISVCKIDKSTGKLNLVQTMPTGGKTPRNFVFDPTGKYILVANQNSDNIIMFLVNEQSGMLTPTGKSIIVGNPVCLWFTKQ